MDTKFSIIVPVYNTEKYLGKCLESICRQTYPMWEAILIDDGSSDASGKICDVFAEKDSRIRVIHKSNEGQAVARNCALKMSCGEYIVFLDSDDYLILNLLDFLHKQISKETKPELITYEFSVLNERNSRKEKLQSNENLCLKIEETDQYGIWKQYLVNKRIGGFVWNKCIKKEIIDKFDIKFPEICAREDLCFFVSLLKKVTYAITTNFVGYCEVLRYGSTEQKKDYTRNKYSYLMWKETSQYIKKKYPALYIYSYSQEINNRMLILSDMVLCGINKANIKERDELILELKNDYEWLSESDLKTPMTNEIDKILNRWKCWVIRQKMIDIKRAITRFKRYLYHIT